ncbi:MAG: hypothetical protein JSW62_01965 [Thermoplasmatales archaeon]|nr:MAG: hypothetical protein JSW62_01965 [Thermoplasmatales archaeon]
MNKKIVGIMIFLLIICSNICMMGSAIKTKIEIKGGVSENFEKSILLESTNAIIESSEIKIKARGGFKGLFIWMEPDPFGYYFSPHIPGRRLYSGYNVKENGEATYHLAFNPDYYKNLKMEQGTVDIKLSFPFSENDKTVKTYTIFILVWRTFCYPFCFPQ